MEFQKREVVSWSLFRMASIVHTLGSCLPGLPGWDKMTSTVHVRYFSVTHFLLCGSRSFISEQETWRNKAAAVADTTFLLEIFRDGTQTWGRHRGRRSRGRADEEAFVCHHRIRSISDLGFMIDRGLDPIWKMCSCNHNYWSYHSQNVRIFSWCNYEIQLQWHSENLCSSQFIFCASWIFYQFPICSRISSLCVFPAYWSQTVNIWRWVVSALRMITIISHDCHNLTVAALIFW